MIKILQERVSNRREEYEAYLEQHIGGVKKAYEKFKDVLLTESDLTVEDLTELDNQIAMHDASKYEDEEFYPYLHHFYPSGAGANDEVSYVRAWNHHQKHNPLHWLYWILQKDSGSQKILDMPEEYIIEMLCDWSSFQYVTDSESTANNWYSKNKDVMILSDNTKAIVEKYLKAFPSL